MLFAWWRSLPSPLFSVPYSPVLIDRNEQLLEVRLAKDEQWRFPPQEVLPPAYLQALLVFEDKRFYDHIGVDFIALARALWQNLTADKVVSGGSTISMQVIRLAKKNPPRTYFEKLKEVIQATRLEVAFSKSEILSMYAAHAPFGGNVVGLTTASWRYFGRAPKQLSWAESALLAILPNSPHLIRPGRNQDRLKAKRNRLLTRLHEQSLLTELDYKLAISEPLPDGVLPFPRRAPHLLETLMASEKQGMITTTVNSDLQQQMHRVAQLYGERIGALGIHHLALTVIDNHSHEVVAYIGNNGYSHAPGTGKAIDLIHRPRSTGSILKPILYAAMLQDGEITPNQLVADVPAKFDGYAPENYDLQFRGAVPAKQALAQSLNMPAVNMLRDYGIHRFYDFLKAEGMSTLFRPADDYGLPLILGGAEGTLWEMTRMYSQLARTAMNLPSKSLAWSEVSLLPEKQESRLTPGAAWLTIQALTEVGRPGHNQHWKQYSSSREIAWKTGTSYGFRDAWAIGVTPEFTVGVWVGNAEGSGLPGLTGTQSAAPLMFEAFNLLPDTTWFQKPQHDLSSVQVCRNDGYLASRYCDPIRLDIPKNAQYRKISPFHSRIHTDASGYNRVSAECESLANMQEHNWFSLPPRIAYFYGKHHTEYRPMPKWRKDCLNLNAAQNPMSFLYPQKGTEVYIPRQLDGTRSSIVAELAHEYPASTVHWYLDEAYIGTTQRIHQQALSPKAGSHKLFVMDDSGISQQVFFDVLSN